MAFVRKKVKTFKWPVEVQEPSATKPGKFEKSEFTAIFKRVKLSELEGVSESEGVSLLKKVLVGWEGIKDEDGDEIEFSEAELDDFADDVDWPKAVLSATPIHMLRLNRETKRGCGLLGFWRQGR